MDFRHSFTLSVHKHFIQMPDIIHIFLNGSVGREFAAACGVQHSHLSPAFFIAVSFFHTFLCFCIGTEVSQNEVSVRTVCISGIQKRIIQITEQLCIVAESSVDKLHQYLTDIAVCVVDHVWIIAAVVFIIDNLFL